MLELGHVFVREGIAWWKLWYFDLFDYPKWSSLVNSPFFQRLLDLGRYMVESRCLYQKCHYQIVRNRASFEDWNLDFGLGCVSFTCQQ
jgi:hypothetical protein